VKKFYEFSGVFEIKSQPSRQIITIKSVPHREDMNSLRILALGWKRMDRFHASPTTAEITPSCFRQAWAYASFYMALALQDPLMLT